MRGADAARLIPPGGRGGSVFSLSILSIIPTRPPAPAPDPDPRPEGVVKDASSSSRGVAGMGMLSVDAVDEGVLSSSFDALRGAVLVLVAAAALMRLLLVIVVVPALGLRILRDGVRARAAADPPEAGVTSSENVDPILLVLTRASGSVPVLALACSSMPVLVRVPVLVRALVTLVRAVLPRLVRVLLEVHDVGGPLDTVRARCAHSPLFCTLSSRSPSSYSSSYSSRTRSSGGRPSASVPALYDRASGCMRRPPEVVVDGPCWMDDADERRERFRVERRWVSGEGASSSSLWGVRGKLV